MQAQPADGVQHAARQSLADLLAYRRSFGAALRDAQSPYGLGVAWGAGLQRSADGQRDEAKGALEGTEAIAGHPQ